MGLPSAPENILPGTQAGSLWVGAQHLPDAQHSPLLQLCPLLIPAATSGFSHPQTSALNLQHSI